MGAPTARTSRFTKVTLETAPRPPCQVLTRAAFDVLTKLTPESATSRTLASPASQIDEGGGARLSAQQIEERLAAAPVLKAACGDVEEADDDDDDFEDMYVDTQMGLEWGGPMRGGRMPEPTRFGDWERKGRASDF